jgi:uncharacterized protein YciI
MSDTKELSLDELRARMLKKKLWVVMSRVVASADDVAKQARPHLEYQIKLERDGIMYGAGPATRPGEAQAAFGLIIIRARDEAEARRIADADPMHSSGARKYELYSWSLNEGRINITLNFSNQSFRFD